MHVSICSRSCSAVKVKGLLNGVQIGGVDHLQAGAVGVHAQHEESVILDEVPSRYRDRATIRGNRRHDSRIGLADKREGGFRQRGIRRGFNSTTSCCGIRGHFPSPCCVGFLRLR